MIEKFTVSRDDDVYEAWPDVAKPMTARLSAFLPSALITEIGAIRALCFRSAATAAKPGDGSGL